MNEEHVRQPAEPAKAAPRPEDTAPLQDTVKLDSQNQPAAGWGAPPASTGWGWGSAESKPSGEGHASGRTESPHVAGWGAPPSASTPQAGAPGGWGAPPSGIGAGAAGRPGAWTLKRGLVVGGAAVVLAAATAAGVYAATSSSAADTAANRLAGPGGAANQLGQGGSQGMPGAQGMQGAQGGGFAPDGFGMGAAGLNAAIHAEYVILRNQSYVTMADQLGTVTAISSDSVSVKSEDGFTRTYSLGSDVQVGQGMRQRNSTGASATATLADVKAGTTIRITAAKNGDAYAAEAIRLVTTTATTNQQGSPQGSSSN